MAVQRYDSGTMIRVEPTPQGGLKIPARLTRTGVFHYPRHDGTVIREYRPPEEVFAPESLASLASAPVTLRHPPKMVNPSNFQKFARGNVHGDPRKDEEGRFIEAVLFVQDAEAIDAVHKDHREVSCGYHCDTIDKPGITPEGEPYDRIQVNIRYNHVALVPKGRAGREVRLRLDSDDNQLLEDEEHMAQKVRIDGVEYEIGTDSYNQARAQQIDRLTAERDAARKDADEQRARADAAEKKIRDLEAKLQEATSPARLDALANARADLISKARSVLGDEVKLDGLSEREIQVKVLQALDPEIKLDQESDDYVRAAFAFATKGQRPETDADKARRDAAAAKIGVYDKNRKTSGERTSREARKDMIEEAKAAWRLPLATSKRAG